MNYKIEISDKAKSRLETFKKDWDISDDSEAILELIELKKHRKDLRHKLKAIEQIVRTEKLLFI